MDVTIIVCSSQYPTMVLSNLKANTTSIYVHVSVQAMNHIIYYYLSPPDLMSSIVWKKTLELELEAVIAV